MEENQFYTIILRHDTSTQWMINNPVLALGEYGVEDDTHRVKRGDGQTKWEDLLYEHFGLESMVTFENLNGNIEDNKQLQEAFDSKVSKDMFSKTDNTIISAINITSEEGVIGRITKVQQNMLTGSTKETKLLIQSTDNSILGLWTVDNKGVDVLNLKATTVIEEYLIGKKYYANQICWYDGQILKAKRTVIASSEVDFNAWEIIGTTSAKSISYNNAVSELEATDVQSVLDELADTKVQKTTAKNKVYGTDDNGNQVTIDIGDIGTVDSVNGIQPDENDNVTITGEDIKFSKTEDATVKQAIENRAKKTYVDEHKVDKKIGDTIVTNIKLEEVSNKPSLTITKGNTSDYEKMDTTYHLDKRGNIQLTVEEDTVIIDSTQIDEKISTDDEKLQSIDKTLENHKNQLEEHSSNIKSLTTDVNRLKNKCGSNKSEEF